MPRLHLLPVLALALFFPLEASAQTVAARYLANEGVLLTHGETKIIVDGLHRPYREVYAVLPPASRLLAENAEDLFGGVDLVLASHRHQDHFSAQAVAAHLKASSRAAFVGAGQMANAVVAAGADPNRVEIIGLQPGGRAHIDDIGYRVELLGIPHVGRTWEDVENVGHVIELGGIRFLHIGDADADARHFAGLGLAERPVDVAFIPHWFLTDPDARAMIAAHIKPRRIVAVHVSPGVADRVRASVLQHYPDAMVFTRPLEDILEIPARER